MSKKFASHIDLQKNELQNAIMQNLSSAPSSPIQGQLYYNTADKNFYIWDGTSWVDLTVQGGTGITNISTTAAPNKVTVGSSTGSGADIIAADATNAGLFLPTEKTKLNSIATGATANASDGQLRDRSTHTGQQASTTISDFSAAADARITAAAGVSLATLTAGKIPSSQIPAIGLVTVQTASSQAAQLALTTQEGDVVVRTDTNTTYMRNAGTAGTMADFTLLNTPTDVVTSVAGRQGVVVLTSADVALGNVDNTSDVNKPVSTAQATADGLRALKSNNLSDLASAATAFGNIKQAATTVATGVVALATQAEAEAKTDTAKSIVSSDLVNFPIKKSFAVGDGTSTSIALTHNLNTRDVVIQVYDATGYNEIECDVVMTSVNVVTLGFTTAPAATSLRAVIVG